MKKRNRLINTRGEIVGLVDDSGIIPDGFGIRVPMTLQDGVPIAAETSLQITDAWGNAAGHRPGYVYGRDSEVQAQDAYNAREAYKARLQDSWKTKPAPVSDSTRHTSDAAPDSAAAHAALVHRTENAWRTGGTR